MFALKKIRFVSLLTVVIFSLTTIYSPQGFSAPISTGAPPPIDVKNLQIDSSFASLEDRFEGSKDRLVVAVQDAHGIFDAQENIRAIIEELQDEYGFNLIALEGGVGKHDHTLLRAFPDKEVLRHQAMLYMRRGELSGGEVAAIINPKAGVFYGIEEKDLYFRNRNSFLKALDVKDANIHTLNLLCKKLGKIRGEICPDELVRFHRAEQKYLREHIALLEFLSILSEYAGKHGMNLEEFPNLNMLFKAVEESRKKGDRAEIDRKVKEMTAEIEGVVLFEEIQDLSANIKSEYFSEHEDIEHLIRLYDNAEILRDLVSLRITRDDFDFYVSHDADFKARVYEDFLGKYGESIDLRVNTKPALEFYRDAMKRDGVLYENLVKAMNKENEDRAVIVAGGFHTDGLKEYLEKDNTSYVIYSPRIETIEGENPYYKVIAGDVSYKRRGFFAIQTILVTMGLASEADVKAFYEAIGIDGLDEVARKATRGETPKDAAKIAQSKLKSFSKEWRDEVIRIVKARAPLRDTTDLMNLIGEITKAAIKKQDPKIQIREMLSELQTAFETTIQGEAARDVGKFADAVGKLLDAGIELEPAHIDILFATGLNVKETKNLIALEEQVKDAGITYADLVAPPVEVVRELTPAEKAMAQLGIAPAEWDALKDTTVPVSVAAAKGLLPQLQDLVEQKLAEARSMGELEELKENEAFKKAIEGHLKDHFGSAELPGSRIDPAQYPNPHFSDYEGYINFILSKMMEVAETEMQDGRMDIEVNFNKDGTIQLKVYQYDKGAGVLKPVAVIGEEGEPLVVGTNELVESDGSRERVWVKRGNYGAYLENKEGVAKDALETSKLWIIGMAKEGKPAAIFTAFPGNYAPVQGKTAVQFEGESNFWANNAFLLEGEKFERLKEKQEEFEGIRGNILANLEADRELTEKGLEFETSDKRTILVNYQGNLMGEIMVGERSEEVELVPYLEAAAVVDTEDLKEAWPGSPMRVLNDEIQEQIGEQIAEARSMGAEQRIAFEGGALNLRQLDEERLDAIERLMLYYVTTLKGLPKGSEARKEFTDKIRNLAAVPVTGSPFSVSRGYSDESVKVLMEDADREILEFATSEGLMLKKAKDGSTYGVGHGLAHLLKHGQEFDEYDGIAPVLARLNSEYPMLASLNSRGMNFNIFQLEDSDRGEDIFAVTISNPEDNSLITTYTVRGGASVDSGRKALVNSLEDILKNKFATYYEPVNPKEADAAGVQTRYVELVKDELYAIYQRRGNSLYIRLQRPENDPEMKRALEEKYKRAKYKQFSKFRKGVTSENVNLLDLIPTDRQTPFHQVLKSVYDRTFADYPLEYGLKQRLQSQVAGHRRFTTGKELVLVLKRFNDYLDTLVEEGRINEDQKNDLMRGALLHDINKQKFVALEVEMPDFRTYGDRRTSAENSTLVLDAPLYETADKSVMSPIRAFQVDRDGKKKTKTRLSVSTEGILLHNRRPVYFKERPVKVDYVDNPEEAAMFDVDGAKVPLRTEGGKYLRFSVDVNLDKVTKPIVGIKVGKEKEPRDLSNVDPKDKSLRGLRAVVLEDGTEINRKALGIKNPADYVAALQKTENPAYEVVENDLGINIPDKSVVEIDGRTRYVFSEVPLKATKIDFLLQDRKGLPYLDSLANEADRIEAPETRAIIGSHKVFMDMVNIFEDTREDMRPGVSRRKQRAAERARASVYEKALQLSKEFGVPFDVLLEFAVYKMAAGGGFTESGEKITIQAEQEMLNQKYDIRNQIMQYHNEQEAAKAAKVDPLLKGGELIKLGVTPGPEVGRFIERLIEEQKAGRVETREEAKEWVRGEISAASLGAELDGLRNQLKGIPAEYEGYFDVPHYNAKHHQEGPTLRHHLEAMIGGWKNIDRDETIPADAREFVKNTDPEFIEAFILLHDIGKMTTGTVDEDGNHSFPGHEKTSYEILETNPGITYRGKPLSTLLKAVIGKHITAYGIMNAKQLENLKGDFTELGIPEGQHEDVFRLMIATTTVDLVGSHVDDAGNHGPLEEIENFIRALNNWRMINNLISGFPTDKFQAKSARIESEVLGKLRKSNSPLSEQDISAARKKIQEIIEPKGKQTLLQGPQIGQLAKELKDNFGQEGGRYLEIVKTAASLDEASKRLTGALKGDTAKVDQIVGIIQQIAEARALGTIEVTSDKEAIEELIGREGINNVVAVGFDTGVEGLRDTDSHEVRTEGRTSTSEAVRKVEDGQIPVNKDLSLVVDRAGQFNMDRFITAGILWGLIDADNYDLAREVAHLNEFLQFASGKPILNAKEGYTGEEELARSIYLVANGVVMNRDLTLEEKIAQVSGIVNTRNTEGAEEALDRTAAMANSVRELLSEEGMHFEVGKVAAVKLKAGVPPVSIYQGTAELDNDISVTLYPESPDRADPTKMRPASFLVGVRPLPRTANHDLTLLFPVLNAEEAARGAEFDFDSNDQSWGGSEKVGGGPMGVATKLSIEDVAKAVAAYQNRVSELDEYGVTFARTARKGAGGTFEFREKSTGELIGTVEVGATLTMKELDEMLEDMEMAAMGIREDKRDEAQLEAFAGWLNRFAKKPVLLVSEDIRELDANLEVAGLMGWFHVVMDAIQEVTANMEARVVTDYGDLGYRGSVVRKVVDKIVAENPQLKDKIAEARSMGQLTEQQVNIVSDWLGEITGEHLDSESVKTFRSALLARGLDESVIKRLSEIWRQVTDSFGTIGVWEKSIYPAGVVNKFARAVIRNYPQIQGRTEFNNILYDDSPEEVRDVRNALVEWLNDTKDGQMTVPEMDLDMYVDSLEGGELMPLRSDIRLLLQKFLAENDPTESIWGTDAYSAEATNKFVAMVVDYFRGEFPGIASEVQVVSEAMLAGLAIPVSDLIRLTDDVMRKFESNGYHVDGEYSDTLVLKDIMLSPGDGRPHTVSYEYNYFLGHDVTVRIDGVEISEAEGYGDVDVPGEIMKDYDQYDDYAFDTHYDKLRELIDRVKERPMRDLNDALTNFAVKRSIDLEPVRNLVNTEYIRKIAAGEMIFGEPYFRDSSRVSREDYGRMYIAAEDAFGFSLDEDDITELTEIFETFGFPAEGRSMGAEELLENEAIKGGFEHARIHFEEAAVAGSVFDKEGRFKDFDSLAKFAVETFANEKPEGRTEVEVIFFDEMDPIVVNHGGSYDAENTEAALAAIPEGAVPENIGFNALESTEGKETAKVIREGWETQLIKGKRAPTNRMFIIGMGEEGVPTRIFTTFPGEYAPPAFIRGYWATHGLVEEDATKYQELKAVEESLKAQAQDLRDAINEDEELAGLSAKIAPDGLVTVTAEIEGKEVEVAKSLPDEKTREAAFWYPGFPLQEEDTTGLLDVVFARAKIHALSKALQQKLNSKLAEARSMGASREERLAMVEQYKEDLEGGDRNVTSVLSKSGGSVLDPAVPEIEIKFGVNREEIIRGILRGLLTYAQGQVIAKVALERTDAQFVTFIRRGREGMVEGFEFDNPFEDYQPRYQFYYEGKPQDIELSHDEVIRYLQDGVMIYDERKKQLQLIAGTPKDVQDWVDRTRPVSSVMDSLINDLKLMERDSRYDSHTIDAFVTQLSQDKDVSDLDGLRAREEQGSDEEKRKEEIGKRLMGLLGLAYTKWREETSQAVYEKLKDVIGAISGGVIVEPEVGKEPDFTYMRVEAATPVEDGKKAVIVNVMGPALRKEKRMRRARGRLGEMRTVTLYAARIKTGPRTMIGRSMGAKETNQVPIFIRILGHPDGGITMFVSEEARRQAISDGRAVKKGEKFVWKIYGEKGMKEVRELHDKISLAERKKVSLDKLEFVEEQLSDIVFIKGGGVLPINMARQAIEEGRLYWNDIWEAWIWVDSEGGLMDFVREFRQREKVAETAARPGVLPGALEKILGTDLNVLLEPDFDLFSRLREEGISYESFFNSLKNYAEDESTSVKSVIDVLSALGDRHYLRYSNAREALLEGERLISGKEAVELREGEKSTYEVEKTIVDILLKALNTKLTAPVEIISRGDLRRGDIIKDDELGLMIVREVKDDGGIEVVWRTQVGGELDGLLDVVVIQPQGFVRRVNAEARSMGATLDSEIRDLEKQLNARPDDYLIREQLFNKYQRAGRLIDALLVLPAQPENLYMQERLFGTRIREIAAALAQAKGVEGDLREVRLDGGYQTKTVLVRFKNSVVKMQISENMEPKDIRILYSHKLDENGAIAVGPQGAEFRIPPGEVKVFRDETDGSERMLYEGELKDVLDMTDVVYLDQSDDDAHLESLGEYIGQEVLGSRDVDLSYQVLFRFTNGYIVVEIHPERGYGGEDFRAYSAWLENDEIPGGNDFLLVQRVMPLVPFGEGVADEIADWIIDEIDAYQDALRGRGLLLSDISSRLDQMFTYLAWKIRASSRGDYALNIPRYDLLPDSAIVQETAVPEGDAGGIMIIDGKEIGRWDKFREDEDFSFSFTDREALKNVVRDFIESHAEGRSMGAEVEVVEEAAPPPGPLSASAMNYVMSRLGYMPYEAEEDEETARENLVNSLTPENLDPIKDQLMDYIAKELSKKLSDDFEAHTTSLRMLMRTMHTMKPVVLKGQVERIADELLDPMNISKKETVKDNLTEVFSAVLQGVALDLVQARIEAKRARKEDARSDYLDNMQTELDRRSMRSALEDFTAELGRAVSAVAKKAGKVKVVSHAASYPESKEKVRQVIESMLGEVPTDSIGRPELEVLALYAQGQVSERIDAIRSYLESLRKENPTVASGLKLKREMPERLADEFEDQYKTTRDANLVFVVPNQELIVDTKEVPVLLHNDKDIPSDIDFVKRIIAKAAVGFAAIQGLDKNDPERINFERLVEQMGMDVTEDPENQRIIVTLNLSQFVEALIARQEAQKAILAAA